MQNDQSLRTNNQKTAIISQSDVLLVALFYLVTQTNEDSKEGFSDQERSLPIFIGDHTARLKYALGVKSCLAIFVFSNLRKSRARTTPSVGSCITVMLTWSHIFWLSIGAIARFLSALSSRSTAKCPYRFRFPLQPRGGQQERGREGSECRVGTAGWPARERGSVAANEAIRPACGQTVCSARGVVCCFTETY